MAAKWRLPAVKQRGAGLHITRCRCTCAARRLGIYSGWLFNSAAARNPDYFGKHVRFAPHVTPAQRTLLWEAETSGGLLLAVPHDQVEIFRTMTKQVAGRLAK